MRVVVTGASGFLGQVLMRELGREGVEVIGASRHALPGLVTVENYAASPSGDVLVHLAEANDRHWVEKSSGSYAETALETLETLLSKGYERVIYSSSAVLYGDQNFSQCCVEDPVFTLDTYTQLKYASEKAVLENNGVVARLVNLYGPGMSENNVLSAILKQLFLKDTLRVLDVQPVRDFLWVEDAAKALVSMVFGRGSGIYNVGTGVGTSILDLAHIALNAAGQKGRLVESAHHESRQSHLVVDITKTTAEFDWKPTTAMSEGIARLVNIIKEQ